MHPDIRSYAKFSTRRRLEKSVNSLLGLIEGISIDGLVSASELELLKLWLDEHEDLQDNHPYNELMPVVASAVEDKILSEEERDDIVWLCNRLTSTEFVDETTADLQRLHAILGGVIADGEITEDELRGLATWMQDHEHLKSCWPYDEIDSLITGVMADGKIDAGEHAFLKAFFSEFTAIMDDRTITQPRVLESGVLGGLCAVCPDIEFEGSTFCFTGASARYKRGDLSSIVKRLGGDVTDNLTKAVTT